jgi:hypothetical protein
MDSKTIELNGLIKGLQMHLVAFPDIMIEIDIVVIDVPDAWGMLLLRKTAADLRGNLQMDLTYATIPTPYGAMFRLNKELERKYHVEDPKKPINELVYRELEMGCYEIQSIFLAYIKEELKDELSSVCNVWDTMDSFDGIFLEEASSERDMDVTLLKSGTELDSPFDTASSTSTHHLSNESVKCKEELDRIFGQSIPYVLEIGDICFDEDDVFDKQDEHKKKEKKRGKSGIDMVRDRKINGDNNNQHIIPIEECANPFQRRIEINKL